MLQQQHYNIRVTIPASLVQRCILGLWIDKVEIKTLMDIADYLPHGILFTSTEEGIIRFLPVNKKSLSNERALLARYDGIVIVRWRLLWFLSEGINLFFCFSIFFFHRWVIFRERT